MMDILSFQVCHKYQLESGLSIDITCNGVEALEQLKQAADDNPYTLVLMDCQMPEMDGYETSTQIRSGIAGERYLEIPKIQATLYDGEIFLLNILK